jgi:hypothetical protein
MIKFKGKKIMKRMIKKMFKNEKVNRYFDNVMKMYSNGHVSVAL